MDRVWHIDTPHPGWRSDGSCLEHGPRIATEDTAIARSNRASRQVHNPKIVSVGTYSPRPTPLRVVAAAILVGLSILGCKPGDTITDGAVLDPTDGGLTFEIPDVQLGPGPVCEDDEALDVDYDNHSKLIVLGRVRPSTHARGQLKV